jgi:hypothetical protein
VYSDHLASGAFGRLPGGALTHAQDSVGAALAIGGRDVGLVTALQDAFMAGLSTSCTVIGTLCLIGAGGALVFLPGRVPSVPETAELLREPVPELEPATT